MSIYPAEYCAALWRRTYVRNFWRDDMRIWRVCPRAKPHIVFKGTGL